MLDVPALVIDMVHDSSITVTYLAFDNGILAHLIIIISLKN